MTDVKLENSSAATKNAVRQIVLGEKILTVGTDGQFATVADALDYIALQTGIQQLTTTAVCDFTQFDNFAPLISGDFGEAEVGDWLYLINDDPAIDTFQYDWHYYRLLSANDGTSNESILGLQMESGVLGPSKVSSTVALYRMPQYTIQLLPGIHDLTGAVFPDGYDVIFEGCGRNTSLIGQGIAVPIYGRMCFQKLILNGNSTLSDTRTAEGGVILDGSFAAMEWRDMWVEGVDATLSANVAAQSQRMSNVQMHGVKGHRIYTMMLCDYMVIDNFIMDSITSMELVEMFTNPRRCATSHKKIVRNSRFSRSQDHSIGPVDYNSQFSMQTSPPEGSHPNYEIDFIDCLFKDDGLKMQSESRHIFGWNNHAIPGLAKSFIRFINSEISNFDSHDFAFGPQPLATIESNLFIEFINTKDGNNLQIEHDFSLSTAIMRYRDKGASADQVWAGGLVPLTGIAEHQIVGPMLANTTMLNPAPVPASRGESLSIHMEQGDVAGYTISWAAATDMKVPNNPSGVGTSLGDKIIFDFYYDGTHWVQTNNPTWA